MRVGKNISETIAVFPESHDISGTVNKAIRLNEESSVYSEHCPGDDPSEVFDLRDYCMGDKLNRIHWKLSSKKDQFIVKDYSLPVDSPAALLLDLRFGENSEYTLPVFDTLIEVFVSLSQLMLENECFHSIIYCDSRKKRFEEKSITNLDSLASAVNDIIFSLANVSEALPPELYFDDEHIRELSSFTYITAEKNEKILSFIDENIDADSKNAIIIVKSTEETDLACGDAGSVEITPVVIGRISSSVKDIEL